MSRRYLFLFGGIVAAALLLSMLARMPHREARAVPMAATAAPRTALELTLDGDRVMPVATQVRKGDEVVLTVVNRGAAAASLTLAGYEDRVALQVAAGGRAEAHFLADRPGDGFVWIVNGAQGGRFVVAGSHLVEGHR